LDRQTMLIIASCVGLICLVGLVIFIRSRVPRRLNRNVSATITDVRVEASSVSSWWTLEAVWSDTQTGQTLTFRSPHLQYPPKRHIGEHVSVNFDAKEPKHYHMEL